jgi:hypothetical protein
MHQNGTRLQICIYLYLFAEPSSEPQVLDGRTYDNPPLYALQVQKLEAHTVNSLNSRNQWLHEFSEDNDLFSYDGMSVGTATGAPFGAVRESSGNDSRRQTLFAFERN